MSLVLEAKVGGEFKPHPEGIYAAVCVDVIDLGLVETEWQGQRKVVRKVRLVFETEQVGADGKKCIVTKTFTASVHPKAKLSEFLGKWRGRPVLPGEKIDLAKLMGACCTLVISNQQNLVGRTYASIDAVSKPAKRLVPSGSYDPALARRRIEEWKARERGEAGGAGTGGTGRGEAPGVRSAESGVRNGNSEVRSAECGVRSGNGTAAPLNPVAAAFPQKPLQAATSPGGGESKSGAEAPHSKAAAAAGAEPEFDPEVGF